MSATQLERVLVIDDEVMLLKLVADYLEDQGYEAYTAPNGAEGLDVFRKQKPDAVLLDLNMPVMDGFEVLDHMKEESAETPFIVVSGAGLIQDAVRAMRHGAWDFITKPITDMEVLELALKRNLERAALMRENRRYREHLEEEVLARTKELRHEMEVRRKAEQELHKLNKEIIDTQREMIVTLGEVVETRSQETANHVRRVAEASKLLALLDGRNEAEAELLRMASPMHDVGKIAIPDAILNKPGKLTPDEFNTIKSHTTIGYEILRHSHRPIMQAAAIAAYQHHERWDGKGYPRGLAGEDIHLYGRITAIADVFDALSHDRVYKKAWPPEKVRELFERERGTHFDPRLTDLLLQHFDMFQDIVKAYPDETS